jgi:SAM-dependent methyltransferase
VEARKYFVEPHIPGFAQFERWRGKRVLEVGCGIGTDSINFARAGARLTAVDLSQESLDVCRRRFRVFGLDADLRQADAERLSHYLEPQPYDLIYSFGVIHHTPNPSNVIRELLKFCGTHTELRLMLYSRWSWKSIWITLTQGKGIFWRSHDFVRKHAEAQLDCPVAFTYTARSITDLLEGFEVQAMWKDHIFPYRVSDYVRYRYKREWYFRWMPPPLFRWLETRLGWHTLIIATPATATLDAAVDER